MTLPQLTGVTGVMLLRICLLLCLLGAFGFGAVAMVAEPRTPTISLESGLGEKVRISRL